MKKLFLVSFLFVGMHLNAQKKYTITQRNFNELKSDLTKAQKKLDITKEKLAYVQKKIMIIAQKKAAQLQKNTAIFINEDSVFETIKKQNIIHFNIAEKRVENRQKKFDKINLKYTLTLKRDSILPNKRNFAPIIHKGMYFSFNPEALFELQHGAVGMGVGYRLTKRVELWAEASYLFKGVATIPENFINLRGIKGVASGKYFFKSKRHFFGGIEFRFKQYSYQGTANFENKQTNDTLIRFPYQPRHQLFGAAVFIGSRYKISKNGKFVIEAIAGTGMKYRFINEKNVPVGYSRIIYNDRHGGFGLPLPKDHFFTEQWLPYFPVSVKIIFHLGKI